MKTNLKPVILFGVLMLADSIVAQPVQTHPVPAATNMPAANASVTNPVPFTPPASVVPSTSPQTPTPASTSPIAGPADIASLTAKEILATNNQVVGQVATMYQHLGLFITIIVTLVGGVATWLSYVARKNVHDFVADWKEKLQALQKEMEDAKTRLHAALAEAVKSASGAAQSAQSITDSQRVLSQTLEDVDRLRTIVTSLEAEVRRQTGLPNPPPPPPTAIPATAPPNEGITAEESAQVAEMLKGKVENGREGGATL